MRAGTVIRVARMVAVRALASAGPVMVAAARVRLNAITAATSQAALAVKRPEGRCARAESLRSAWTCSMIAWPRWVLSALTVSRSLVVKNAWKRQVPNRAPWPWLLLGLRSGMRRTTNRPGICSVAFLELNAVNAIAAIAVLTVESRRTVIDTWAPPRIAAATEGCP